MSRFSLGEREGQRRVMDKVWHSQNLVKTVKIFFGFDCLKLIPEELGSKLDLDSGVRARPRFQILGVRAQRAMGVYSRRFACGMILGKIADSEKSTDPMVIRDLFICETPQAGLEDPMPYLRYWLWGKSISPLGFLHDVLVALISDVEEVVDQAATHVSLVVRNATTGMILG
jgi:hypothetical protein